MSKRLTIIRGLPSAGKSKAADNVYRRRDCAVIEWDYIREMTGAKNTFSGLTDRQVLKQLGQQARYALDQGKNVCIVGVLPHSNQIANLLMYAELPPEQREVIHITGGDESRVRYSKNCMYKLQSGWQRVHGEKYRKLDPSQPADFKGPRRLIAVDDIEVKVDAQQDAVKEPVKKVIKFHPSMLKNRPKKVESKVAAYEAVETEGDV